MSRAIYSEYSRDKNIEVLAKINEVFSRKIAGYKISLKETVMTVTVETMIKLIDLGYVRGFVQNGRINSFANFKELQSEVVPYLNQVQFVDIQQVLQIINTLAIEKFTREIKKSDSDKILAEKESRNSERALKSQEILEKSKSNDFLYIYRFLRPERGLELVGYELAHKGRTIRVTRTCALNLAKDGKIHNAQAKYNSQTGDYISVDCGNRLIESVAIQNYEIGQLANEIPIEVSTSNPDIIKKAITGCIFNQVGKLIGVQLQIGTQQHNLNIKQFKQFYDKNRIKITHGVTDAQFAKWKNYQNMEVHKLYGVEFVHTLKIVHQAMTVEMSLELFGKEHTIIVDTHIDYGNKTIRDKVVQQEHMILDSILKTGRNWVIPKSSIRLIARAKTASFTSYDDIKDSTIYIIEYNGVYIAIPGNIISSLLKNNDTGNLPYITLWNGEVRYTTYSDGDKIIVTTSNRIRNSIKERYNQ